MEKYNTTWPIARATAPPTKETYNSPSLTIPNLALDIDTALNKFSAQSIEKRLKGYYEQEGMQMPDFDRMDKIQRLTKLAEVRETVNQLKEKAAQRVSETEAKLKKSQTKKSEQ